MTKTADSNIVNVRVAARHFFFASLLFGLAALPLGCDEGGEEEVDEGISAKTSAVTAPDGEGKSFRHHRKSAKQGRKDGRKNGRGFARHGKKGGRRHDPAGMLFKAALHQDSVTADQKAKIESMIEQKPGKGQRGARGEKGKAFRATLAQAVRDGRLDASVMAAHMEEMTKQREERRAAGAERLNALYATLDATQRQAVVDELKARRDGKGRKFEGRKGPKDGFGKGYGKGKRGRRGGRGEGVIGEGPDGAKDGKGFRGKRGCPDGEGKGFRGRRGGHGGRGAGVMALLKGLDLSEAQQAQIDALKQEMVGARPDKAQRAARREEMAQCWTDFLDSFAGDDFDAAAARCGKDADKDRKPFMAQHAETFSSLMAILTETQRNQIADRLENPPPKRNAL
jgi:Spy/CpxP family protein refolding chaperone